MSTSEYDAFIHGIYLGAIVGVFIGILYAGLIRKVGRW